VALLEAGFAHNIALADKDNLVASFWKTVFSNQASRLAEMIERANVSVSVREAMVASMPTSHLARAFKCIYVNRTSFSGILNSRAGPLGGRDQASDYTIGCRFNQVRLAARIRELSAFRGSVSFVECQSYVDTVRKVRGLLAAGLPEGGLFWYLDPPFFEKADRLYRHVFSESDHQQLHDSLSDLPGSFVLSYDGGPAAERMYGGDSRAMAVPFGRTSVSMIYAAAERDLRSARELIVSNLLAEAKTKIGVHNRARAARSRRA
jgi:DNA adenine methylase